MTNADLAFSKCVKERADYKCEHCGTSYRENDAGLDCSHNFSRAYKAIRYHPDNAFALCYHCHKFWWHSNPIDSAEWAVKKLGKDKIRNLRKLRENNIEPNQERVAAYYSLVYQQMKKLREQGKTGRIEFDNFSF